MGRDLLEDSSSESDADQGGVELEVNEQYARRFEHNKKREELLKLEEKHGKISKKRKRSETNEHYSSSSASADETSSDSADEDDEGELVTELLDTEIQATLNAIKSKDPRVYDGSSTFYRPIEDHPALERDRKEKPMYLRDYHITNLLNNVRPVEETTDVSMTYDEEQSKLKSDVVKAMHTAGQASSDDEESDDLLVAKEKPRQSRPVIELDVANANKDPETFLSNFMTSRAWVPTEKAVYQPLESDDEEDERRAEAFEEAYNMRFEDPAKSNEKLRSHARDMAAAQSVRREEKNARQKNREQRKAAKEFEKQQIREEKARLKKLRIEEVEDRVNRIKDIAGLTTSDLTPSDWAHFVNDDWDDAQWEEAMHKRFGDAYYAQQEEMVGTNGDGKKNRPKKPKFDDDIDINDIIPDFQANEDANFSLSDDNDGSVPRQSKKKTKKQARDEKKKESRKERRIIEQLVDDQLQMELDRNTAAKNNGSMFRYRETSPTDFGLTSRDILLADDSQLNQFAGLKKLAAFRDADKKRKDKKHLGKKARLRKWRLDTFGDEEGPVESSSHTMPHGAENDAPIEGEHGVDLREGRRKRHKRKKSLKTAKS